MQKRLYLSRFNYQSNGATPKEVSGPLLNLSALSTWLGARIARGTSPTFRRDGLRSVRSYGTSVKGEAEGVLTRAGRPILTRFVYGQLAAPSRPERNLNHRNSPIRREVSESTLWLSRAHGLQMRRTERCQPPVSPDREPESTQR